MPGCAARFAPSWTRPPKRGSTPRPRRCDDGRHTARMRGLRYAVTSRSITDALGYRIAHCAGNDACKYGGGSASLPDQLQPFVFGQHRDAMLFGLGEFRAGAWTSDKIVCLLRYRTRCFGAKTLRIGLCLFARHPLKRTRKNHDLARDGGIAPGLFGIEDGDLPGQPLDDAAIMALAEIGGDAGDHRVADLVQRIHLRDGLLVAPGDPIAGVGKALPGAVTTRQRQCRGLADLAHAERIDEALQCDVAAAFDRGKQIANRRFAIAFELFELDPGIARRQREDIRRLLHPALFEKQLDLLFTETVDIEGAARGEQLEVLDLLVGAGEFAGAAGAGALLAGGGFLAHHVGAQRARTFLRKVEFLGVVRPLVNHDIDHWRNNVAGALDDNGIADHDLAALAQLLAIAAKAFDVILVVQRDVLHDHAADADRLELADRRKPAGAADLNLDIPQHGHGALGREFMRDGPARRARNEAEPVLPVDPVDLVHDAIDIIVEMRAQGFDLAMEAEQFFHR